MVSDSFIRLFFFMINPFLSMFLAFKEYTMPYAKNIFWAFCTFYGFTFAIGRESIGGDIIEYVKELKYLHLQYNFGIEEIFKYFHNSGEIDVLRTFISFVLSRFTDNQGVLTMVYAFIFGFFFSRNIWYLLNLLKGRITLLTKVLILVLILVMPIWMINGFRMWTAFHIFIYGLLPYLFENRKDKLIFLFLSILVHFSFIIPISVFLLYVLLGNRTHLFFWIFIISIFVSEINISSVNSNIETLLPRILLERTEGYRNEDAIEQKKNTIENSNKRWYLIWKNKSLNWVLYLLLVYFYFFVVPEIKLNVYWNSLFSFNLLFYSVANIFSTIPSGGRFLNISFFLTLMMMILYLNYYKNDFRYKLIIKVLSPVFLLVIIVSIRVGFYSMSLTTVLGNPIIALFNFGDTKSLNDFLK